MAMEAIRDNPTTREDAKMQIDAADITRALTTFFESGDVFEIRALDARLPSDYIHKKPRTLSGYFDTAHIKELCEALERMVVASGVYFTLNPVNPDLLARCAYRLQEPKATTADKDITTRRWLPLDFDAERPSGISSSNEEHQKALNLAAQTAEKLSARFGVHPVCLDSGNGAHLLYKIDLPNDPEATALVKGVLETLSAEASIDGVKLDSVNFNAARIWKLSGTYARKGDNMDARPHRMARVLTIPEDLQPVSMEALQEVAKANQQTTPTPTQAKTASPSAPSAAATRKFDGAEWVQAHFPEARRQAYQGGNKWILKECPFNPDHNRGEATIFQTSDGKMGFKCQHDSCSGYHWKELREKIEPGCYDPKEEASNVDIAAILTSSNTKTNATTATEAPKTHADAKKPTTPTETGDAPKIDIQRNIIELARAAREKAKRLSDAQELIAEIQKRGAEKAVGIMSSLGISAEVCMRLGIGTHPESGGVVIPYIVNGETRGYAEIKDGQINLQGAANLPFHADVLKEPDLDTLYGGKSTAGVVFAVSDIMGALAIEQSGYPCIVTSGAPSELAEVFAKGSARAKAVFYLGANDQDKNGLAKLDRLQALIESCGLDFGTADPKVESCYCWLRDDPEGLKRYLKGLTEDYHYYFSERLKGYQAQYSPAGFRARLDRELKSRKLVKTGFKDFDAALGGGFGNELVIIGSQSGMGKTTFCLQMAEQLSIANNRDILYFGLEQDEIELAVKGIARHTFEKTLNEVDSKSILSNRYDTDPNILQNLVSDSAEYISAKWRLKIQKAIDKGKDSYFESAKRIHFICCRGERDFGHQQIRKFVAGHRQATGEAPIVIVDYLQILKDAELSKRNATDREIIETNIHSLSQVARHFGTTVILISAFNRGATHGNADMDAFNGTSKIEFSADYLFSLQPDTDFLANNICLESHYKPIYVQGVPDIIRIDGFKNLFNPYRGGTTAGGVMPMAIKILKQRLGAAGAPIKFVYKPKCEIFRCEAYQLASYGQSAFYLDWERRKEDHQFYEPEITPLSNQDIEAAKQNAKDNSKSNLLCVKGGTSRNKTNDKDGTSNSDKGNGKKKKEKKEDFILKE